MQSLYTTHTTYLWTEVPKKTFFVGVIMVPKHSTYYQQHDAHYLLSVLSLGASLSLVLIDTVCVCVRHFRKSVDGPQEMELKSID